MAPPPPAPLRPHAGLPRSAAAAHPAAPEAADDMRSIAVPAGGPMGSPPEPVQRGSTPAPGRAWALPHRNPPGVAVTSQQRVVREVPVATDGRYNRIEQSPLSGS